MAAPAPKPAAAPPSPPRPFTFDVEFSGGRVITPVKPKTQVSIAELDAAKAEAYAEGQASAVARAEADAATALAAARRDIADALSALKALAHEHRVASAELALACGRAIAGAALDALPEACASAALTALAREIEAQPRLLVRASPEAADRTRAALERAAEAAGHAGAVTVKPEPGLSGAAFSFDWGDGRAAFDPAAASARVGEALAAALAAEGLHAEPPLPLFRPSEP